MSDFKKKFSLAGKPFLIVSVCFLISYSFLHWLLYLKNDLIPVREIVFLVFAPMILAVIPVWIWIRPALKKFSFKRKDNPVFRLSALAVLMITAFTSVFQIYLTTATGEITRLNKIEECPGHPKTKYYSVKNYFMDTAHKGITFGRTISGKRNRDLNFHFIAAIPIFEQPSDTFVRRSTSYWLIQPYKKTISNRKNSTEKEQALESFKTTSLINLRSLAFQNITYLERIKYPDRFDDYERAVYSATIMELNRPSMFLMHKTPFSERNGYKLLWSLAIFIVFTLFWLLVLFLTKTNP